MLRSLFSGVSGLSGNLVELDVVGNNIANTNTVGFKSARVTFQEILTQNIRPASRPSDGGGLGGTNPQQVGLGTIVGSIDTQFAQGNLRTTGNKLDMAIQGEGFFVMSDGRTNVYSRAGNLTFDANNTLVNGSGYKVQGVLADVDGTFTTGSLSDITLDPSTVVPARASRELTIFGNLNSGSDAQGTLLEQRMALLSRPVGGDSLLNLYSSRDGQSLRLVDGSTIALEGLVGGSGISDSTFTVGVDGDGSTLEELRAWMETELQGSGATGTTVTLNADGTLAVDNSGGSATLQNISLTSGGSVAFNTAMNFGDVVDPGEIAISEGGFLAPAVDGDFISDVLSGAGQNLGLNFTDDGTGRMTTTLVINGLLGPLEAITPVNFEVEEGVTTVSDLMSRIATGFGISDPSAISLGPDGKISIRGDVGIESAIANLSIGEVGNSDAELSNALEFRTIEDARNADTYVLSSTVYDSLGETHSLSLNFTKRTGENVWDWVANLDGDEEIISGATGTVSFDEDGRLLSFAYTDGGGQIGFRPQPLGENGAAVVNLTVNPGRIGGVTGLTQYEQTDQIQGYSDGFTVGRLLDFDIDRQGVITGRFSNDTVRPLARLSMARFNNPGGLVRIGNNAYTVSGNSGQPVGGFATEGSMGELASGALEASNVDLSEQFTRLVVAQRSFQGNARVITTSDEILQELVNIV